MLGDVAQLGERLLCTQEAVGSIPIISTRFDLGARWRRVTVFYPQAG